MLFRRSCRLVTATLVTLAAPAAGDAESPTALVDCRLALAEETRELDELVLAHERSEIDAATAEQLFELVEDLLAGEAIERMRWLNFRYDRDRLAVGAELQAARVERQRALVERLTADCDRSESAGEAFDRYVAADCDVRRLQVDAAGVELAFRNEWLETIEELKQHRVTAAAQIIEAQRDVALAEHGLAHARGRLDACAGSQPTPSGGP